MACPGPAWPPPAHAPRRHFRRAKAPPPGASALTAPPCRLPQPPPARPAGQAERSPSARSRCRRGRVLPRPCRRFERVPPAPPSKSPAGSRAGAQTEPATGKQKGRLGPAPAAGIGWPEPAASPFRLPSSRARGLLINNKCTRIRYGRGQQRLQSALLPQIRNAFYLSQHAQACL